MFPEGKFNTDISRNTQYMALFWSPSDRKQIGIIAKRMFHQNRPRFMSAYVQEIERVFSYIFVDNRLDTPSDNQVLSDIFGSRRRYPTINSSAKSEETVKTTSYKENITCEGSSAVKWPPVVKSSPPIAKSGGHFFLIQFCLQQPIPLYKIICKERPDANPTKSFWNHGTIPHCWTSLWSVSSIVLVWKLLRCENMTLLQWKSEMDLFAQGRSQRKIFPTKEPNECSIDQ